jgi:hypothetical protein
VTSPLVLGWLDAWNERCAPVTWIEDPVRSSRKTRIHGSARRKPNLLPSTRFGRMNAIHLTDTEMEMAKHALQAYLQTFGHDEADTVTEIRRVIAKLHAAEAEDDDSAMPA